MPDFVITKAEADQTIVSFLKKRFKTTPLSLIYKLFRTKKVQVDGRDIRYYHHRLKFGEKVSIADNSLKIPKLTFSPPEKMVVNFQVIYEDENMLIVVKEHNLPMRSLDDYCLDKMVKYYLYQQNPVQYQKLVESFFVFTAVHRLDKLTKGLVIYPKNPTAKRLLYDAMNDKEKITKKYLALCENSTKKPLPNYISGFLWKNESATKMEFSLDNKKENTKDCAMEITELRQEKNQLLLEITLHTGRKHQIRSVLAYFDRPVIGDKKYGSKTIVKDKIFLFAYKITFGNLSAPLSYLKGQEFQITELVKNKLSWLTFSRLKKHKMVGKLLARPAANW